jgi:hypothetical protein
MLKAGAAGRVGTHSDELRPASVLPGKLRGLSGIGFGDRSPHNPLSSCSSPATNGILARSDVNLYMTHRSHFGHESCSKWYARRLAAVLD